MSVFLIMRVSDKKMSSCRKNELYLSCMVILSGISKTMVLRSRLFSPPMPNYRAENAEMTFWRLLWWLLSDIYVNLIGLRPGVISIRFEKGSEPSARNSDPCLFHRMLTPSKPSLPVLRKPFLQSATTVLWRIGTHPFRLHYYQL